MAKTNKKAQDQLTWLPKKTFELKLTIPWSEVEKTYSEVTKSLAQNLKLKGFRKGQAPPKIVEQNLDQGKIYGEVINKLLPKAYAQAVTQHQLKPAIPPKIQIIKAEKNKAWQFKAVACELPEVKLGNYQQIAKGAAAKDKIWTPDKGDPTKKEDKQPNPTAKLNQIIKALLDAITIELPQLMIDSESDRLLSRLLQDAQKLGLTIDQYAASLNKSVEQLKQEQQLSAEQTIKMELILQAIADDNKLKVADSEIDKMIDATKDEKLKKQLKTPAEKAYLTSVLRKRKAIDYLLSL